MTSNYPPGVTGAEPQIAGDPTDESLSDRIRQWDDWVEDEDPDQEEARRPFDAGIMLAVAKLLERWETGDLAEAMRELTDTVEAVLDGSGAFADEEEEVQA